MNIDEGEESKVNGIDQIFNTIIEENFPQVRKDTPMQIQKAHRTQNIQDQKRKS